MGIFLAVIAFFALDFLCYGGIRPQCPALVVPLPAGSLAQLSAVSYTHLEVYKRQFLHHAHDGVEDHDQHDQRRFKELLRLPIDARCV